MTPHEAEMVELNLERDPAEAAGGGEATVMEHAREKGGNFEIDLDVEQLGAYVALATDDTSSSAARRFVNAAIALAGWALRHRKKGKAIVAVDPEMVERLAAGGYYVEEVVLDSFGAQAKRKSA